MIDVDVVGLDSVIAALEGAVGDLIPAAARGLEQGLDVVAREAKKNCPVDTGELRNSIRAQVDEYATFVTGEVGSHKDYAVYVEMGTGPVGKESGGNGSGVPVSYSTGEYVAQRKLKNGKIVRFVTDGWFFPTRGGGYRFTRGQPARPFLWPAWKANKGKVLATIRSMIKKSLRGG